MLTDTDITQIAETYHKWRNSPDRHSELVSESFAYEDIPGFCASATIDKVKELDYVLTPGRYVGLVDDEDDFDFNERFLKLKAEFEEQLKEETILNKQITENLLKIKLNDEK